MESRAKLAGHPIHQMMIVFPLGLLGCSVIFDLIYLYNHNGRIADASFWMIAAGVVAGLAAAVFGLVDWVAIPAGTRAKAIGAWHGTGNVIVVALFALSWYIRYQNSTTAPPNSAIILSVMALLLAGVTGWLGGELVDRLGVGVADGAHLNATSSLSGRPATESDPHYEASTASTSIGIASARSARPGGRNAEGAERRDQAGARTGADGVGRTSDRGTPPG